MITKNFWGVPRYVPEDEEEGWEDEVTGILVDTCDALNGLTGLSGTTPFLCLKKAAATQTVAAGGTITPGDPVVQVQGDGGAVICSAATAISDGAFDGQLLVLQGASDANHVTIYDAANTRITGGITLRLGEGITLRWSVALSLWEEVARANSGARWNQGALDLHELRTNGIHRIRIQAPAALAGDLTWTLPSVSAVGFLYNDGAGTLTWGAGAASLDTAYDVGRTITVDAGPVSLDFPTGGEVLEIKASTSGDPYISIEAGTSTMVVKTVHDGVGRIGTTSNNNLELHANNAVRFTVMPSGNVEATGDVKGATVTATGAIAGASVAATAAVTGASGAFTQAADATAFSVLKTGVGAGTVLSLENDGTGNCLYLNQDGAGVALNIDAGAATAVTATQPNNFAIAILTKTGAGAGNAVTVHNDGTGIGLAIVQDGAGYGLDIDQNGAETGFRLIQSGASIAAIIYQGANYHALDCHHSGAGAGSAALFTNDGTAAAVVIAKTTATGAGLDISTAGGAEILINGDVQIRSGNGSPEGVVVATRGSIYLRRDGGVGTSFYVKEANDFTASGWAAK